MGEMKDELPIAKSAPKTDVEQLVAAKQALGLGKQARLRVRGYSVTCFVAGLDAEGDTAVFAVWFKDHLGGALTDGGTFTLTGRNRHRRAANVAMARLRVYLTEQVMGVSDMPDQEAYE